jgi:hypothetical protein
MALDSFDADPELERDLFARFRIDDQAQGRGLASSECIEVPAGLIYSLADVSGLPGAEALMLPERFERRH